MGCDPIKMPDGTTGWACSRGRGRRAPCVVCGRPSVSLCDFPLRGAKDGATCDRALCATHAHRQGKHESGPYKGDTIDYCLVHHEMSQGQQKLPFGREG